MDIVRTARERGPTLVRFLWCGNYGTVLAKATALGGLEGRLNSGIGVTLAMEAMNSLDRLQPVEGMYRPAGRGHRPDPTTFRVLPYAPRTVPSSPTRSVSTATRRRCASALSSSGWRPPSKRAGHSCARGSRNEFTLARLEGREMATGRLQPLLLDHRVMFFEEYVDALVEALETAGHRRRPVLRRARARSTGADHRTRSGAARRRPRRS